MFEIDKAQFGAFVAAQRKKKGYTQKELAQRLYVSDKAVSKWERGVSTPDISLLIPLADCLGVTVTELLEGRKLEPAREPEAEHVEELVRKALVFSEKGSRSTAKQKIFRVAAFTARVAVILAELALLAGLGYDLDAMMRDTMGTSVIIIIMVAAFAWLSMEDRLPPIYDENRINMYTDGHGFKFSLMGVWFSNRNWPHILRVLRGWSVFHAVLVGPFYFILTHLGAGPWRTAGNVIWMLLFMGGFFIPAYKVGKKYE